MYLVCVPKLLKLTKSLSFKVGGAFRNELSTPPLQKTINSKEDVRSHLFEEQENIGSPQLEAAISVIPLVRTTSYSALYLRWPVCLFIFAGLQTESTRFWEGRANQKLENSIWVTLIQCMFL